MSCSEQKKASQTQRVCKDAQIIPELPDQMLPQAEVTQDKCRHITSMGHSLRHTGLNLLAFLVQLRISIQPGTSLAHDLLFPACNSQLTPNSLQTCALRQGKFSRSGDGNHLPCSSDLPNAGKKTTVTIPNPNSYFSCAKFPTGPGGTIRRQAFSHYTT